MKKSSRKSKKDFDKWVVIGGLSATFLMGIFVGHFTAPGLYTTAYVNPSSWDDMSEHVAQFGSSKIFVCQDAKSLGVEFGNRVAQVSLDDGRKFTLEQTPSAGGARYADANDDTVLWNVGQSVSLEEKGKKTYNDCIL